MKLVPEIGIDLGTSNLLVHRRGQGIVLSEPTVVAISNKTGKVVALGKAARDMIGRTPTNITAIRPMKDGVIADRTTTMNMIRYIIKETCSSKMPFNFAPTTLLCVPSGVTNVERRAVIKAAKEAGAGIAMTIEEPFVAALGAGLPIYSPGGNMVMDIGGGTTDIAVLSLGGIVLSQSIRVAGGKMDEAIQRHIRNVYNLMIGEMTAEEIKIRLGTAYTATQEARMEVRGRDLIHGLPKTIEVSSVEIREALNEPVRQIAEKLCQVLEETPPELASDVIERGITLTGGGALLRGLDRYLSEVTQLQVTVADNPLTCVAIGTGMAIESLDEIRNSGALTFL